MPIMIAKEDGSYEAVVYDLEVDPVTLRFEDDYYVEIDTSGLKYLHFNREGLEEIIKLLEKAKQKFNNRNND